MTDEMVMELMREIKELKRRLDERDTMPYFAPIGENLSDSAPDDLIDSSGANLAQGV